MSGIPASPDHLHALAASFFREFSRAEYCLKAAGFVAATRDAKANWSSLARDMVQHLDAPTDPALQTAADYLLHHPPKKQVIENGRLGWDPVLPTHQSKTELLLLLVCRVRNNLFHGGKFNGQWFEPERSEQLLESALAVISACVSHHPRLREAYHGAAF